MEVHTPPNLHQAGLQAMSQEFRRNKALIIPSRAPATGRRGSADERSQTPGARQVI